MLLPGRMRINPEASPVDPRHRLSASPATCRVHRLPT